ncbi:MAG: M48 family metalloprotease [Leptolyngbya sp. SIO1D8]|nr:M48 family metalloprotease [Leptolyngbya sp. SIO1D8]
MNFFEHQEQARHNTTRLVALFFLAIAIMIGAFYLIPIMGIRSVSMGQIGWWHPTFFCLVTAVTLGIIGFGSLTKMSELRQGGAAVAKSLGGRQVIPQTRDPQEQQLLNVVAEMALASGTPIPTVYLLSQEIGINAFAAGYSPDDAVIGVTQGCLKQLTRDELQGVIAHEFSHILNGDMRLNLKLIGVLHGLLFVHILGRGLLRTGWEVSIFDFLGGDDDDSGRGGLLLVGLMMAIIGSIGLVVGRLIKSAISRQREFLADASAIQFTRNPTGLSGALRRIGGFDSGSKIRTPKAEEASHLFFGEAITLNFMSDWLATHPPLKERIRRISGVKVAASLPNRVETSAVGFSEANIMKLQGQQSHTSRTTTTQTAPTAPPDTANKFLAAVGTATSQQLAKAHAFLQGLPPELSTAVRSPNSAMAFIYALLIDHKPEVRSRQLQLLQSTQTLADAEQVLQFAQILRSMDSRQHLPLLDLSIPVLRTITARQCAQFFKQIQALVRADGRLSLSEYVLQLILQKRLRPHFQKKTTLPNAVTSLDSVWKDCQVVLTILARIGHQKPEDAFYAFKSGMTRLPGAHKRELPKMLPKVTLYDLGQSLQRLEAAIPKLKQAIVDAAAHTVLLDNDVTSEEAELLRAIVITLDCPIPPFLEAKPKPKKVRTTAVKRNQTRSRKHRK